MVESLAEAQSHPITPEAFLKHDVEIRTAKREMEDCSAALARAKKTAKSGSVNLLAYKFMEQIRKLDDDERPIVVRTFMQYCAWLEMPIGTQSSLMDAPKVPVAAKKQHSVFMAGENGRKAGREGDPSTINPHQPGSEQHVAWAKQHLEGLAERATAASMEDTENEHVADTAPATRKAARGRGGAGAAAAARNGSRSLSNSDLSVN